MNLTTEQVLELIERIKDDRAIIAAGDVRQLADLALWALDDDARLAAMDESDRKRDAAQHAANDARTDRYARQESAATILAALIQAETAAAAANGGKREIVVKALIPDAVGLADALRAELGKTGGGGK